MGFRFTASKLLRRFGFDDQFPILGRLDRMQEQLDKLQQGLLANPLIIQRLERMQLQLNVLERMSHGGRAAYLGNDRILTKCVIAEAVIGYLIEADDILLSPWFILTGEHETDITNFFLKNLRPDSRCLDVGANFGFFTCLMARFCHQGKVMGIEPNHHVDKLLRDNIYINGLQEWTTSKHAAISDSAGTVELYRRVKRSRNTSGTAQTDDSRAALFVAPAQAGVQGRKLGPRRPGTCSFAAMRPRPGWVSSVRAEPLVSRMYLRRFWRNWANRGRSLSM